MSRRSRPILPTQRQRVLIVDDEIQNRQLLEVMLATEGVDVTMASSGEEALASVAAAPPDLVLLDIMMPGMDGYSVTAKLKADRATKNIPVIVITALDDRSARLQGLSAGAEDYLSKPIDRAELCMRVRNLLRLKAYGDYHDKHSQWLETEVDAKTTDLIESERLYRSTFDAAPIGIVHVALDGRWLRVNQYLCELLGYTREELLRFDAQAAKELAVIAPSSGEPSLDEEQQYRRKDGSLVWVRMEESMHRDADGSPQHCIRVVQDISERRTLESQLRQASKMDAIGQLASGVAHDFNNLLSVVVSYSEMLAEDLQEGDPMRSDLEEIKAAGWRAVDLTRQLLAFSRQQVLQPKVVDLTAIVVGMEKMLRRLIGENVELMTTFAPSLGSVLVDPGQVEQVIVNLAVNARDAMPGGGRLAIETSQIVLDEAYASEHVGMKAGPHVVLSVSDTGSGMDQATQTRMFEPFFTTKEVGKGTGLGLATVFGIVRQSGGTIWVDSKVGSGTQFKVFLPTTDGTATTHADRPRPERHSFRGSETILLVEDEEAVRTLARTILRKFGYNVLEAQSGGDAFLMCEQHPSKIHLLLTDVVMPRMSGRQLADRLLQIRPDMKVLYMSGYTDDAIVRDGHSDSSIALLQKPITPEVLGRIVREVLSPASSDA